MKPLLVLRSLIAAAWLCVSIASPAAIQLAPTLTSGLAEPVFVGNAKDGSNRLFIVERGGVIRVLQPGRPRQPFFSTSTRA